MKEESSARLSLDDDISRGPQVEISVNGAKFNAFIGETVAAALFALEKSALRTTVNGEPRGVFCGMGVCFDCLVVVDGLPNTRACMTWIQDGMVISTQQGLKASVQ